MESNKLWIYGAFQWICSRIWRKLQNQIAYHSSICDCDMWKWKHVVIFCHRLKFTDLSLYQGRCLTILVWMWYDLGDPWNEIAYDDLASCLGRSFICFFLCVMLVGCLIDLDKAVIEYRSFDNTFSYLLQAILCFFFFSQTVFICTIRSISMS